MAKRLFDIISAIIGLAVLSPVLLYIAWRIRTEDDGPVFYRGKRVGRKEKIFRIYKFRTMVVNAELMGPSSTSEDDPRITQIGRILRRYKLDELPQLINVLNGDMSIVGPRPQVKWAVDLFSPQELEILIVRPGITDMASIRFANEEEILKGSADPDKDYMEKIHPEKMRMSLEYVRNRSFAGDMMVIARTLGAILKKI